MPITSWARVRLLVMIAGAVAASAVVFKAVVFKKAVSPEAWEAVDGAGQESTLRLAGRVKKDDRAPGGYEIDVQCRQC